MATPRRGAAANHARDLVTLEEVRNLIDPTMPSGALAATMRRDSITSVSYQPLTSQRLQLFGLRGLWPGDTVTNISFMSGSTAGASLTRVWFALYDASRNLLGKTVDDTAAAWATNTVKTLALTTPYVVPATAGGLPLYYVGIMVHGTTLPTITGSAGAQASASGVAPIDVGSSNTGLTTSAPNPANALTNNVAGKAWAWLT